MFINPYENVNFITDTIIPSFTHGHMRSSGAEQKYEKSGFRHWPVSNYRPSKPLSNEELSELGITIPSEYIWTSNAEHYNSIINGENVPNFHFCSVGSTFSSGSADGDPNGVQDTWKNAFHRIIKSLLYPDAGGITLNHPTWSINHGVNMNADFIIDKLKYADSVLGIEVLNGGAMNKENPVGYSESLWDDVLCRGYRCWGFFTPDWGVTEGYYRGYNMLYVPQFTNYNCLKAYRNGAFYGADSFDSPKFTNISYNKSTNQFNVSCDSAISIDIIIDGVKTTYSSNTVSVLVPSSATYCRAVAKNDNINVMDGISKTSWTQPIMINAQKIQYNNTSNVYDFLFFL